MLGTKTYRFLPFVSALALGGCGGGDDGETTTTTGHEHSGGERASHHGEHHGEGHGHAEWDAPATIIAFHDALAPAWHAEPDDARREAMCAAVEDLDVRAAAIGEAPAPDRLTGPGEDWITAAVALGTAVNDLRGACEESPPGDAENRFSAVHDAFHALTEQLPGHDH